MQSGCSISVKFMDNELSRINEVHMTTPRVKFNRHRPKGRGLTHPVTYSEITCSDSGISGIGELYFRSVFRKNP